MRYMARNPSSPSERLISIKDIIFASFCDVLKACGILRVQVMLYCKLIPHNIMSSRDHLRYFYALAGTATKFTSVIIEQQTGIPARQLPYKSR